QVLHFLNDHEGDLAHILYLIRLCPNDHEVAPVRSLEPFHRLVRLYPKKSGTRRTMHLLNALGGPPENTNEHATADPTDPW
ncbi:MAG: hypothetical protein ABI396_06380, partial [Ktedonobacteraceae bacterium]